MSEYADDHLDDLYETAVAVGAAHQAEDASPCAGLDRPLWEALEKTGFTGLAVSEGSGGTGGDLLDAATVLGALGTARVPYAEATLIAGPALSRAGLRLPPGPLTAGRFDGSWDGAVLRGAARGVPWARDCDTAVLILDGREATVHVVDLHGAGVSCLPGTNLAGEARDELRLDGTVPLAHAPLTDAQAREWPLRGAAARTVAMAGLAERVVEATHRYVQEREQFGRPLARFQAVQHALARLAADSFALRAAAGSAVRALRDGGLAAELTVASAKSEASTLARPVTAAAHQAHGAIGFTREHALGALTTRLWAWREEYGHELHWQRRVSELAHGADLWDLVTGHAENSTSASTDRELS
ncbi:acyl-CoA dehydrogenase family protein [Streptomyces albidoflavus]